jgi:integrase/recombinase XerD
MKSQDNQVHTTLAPVIARYVAVKRALDRHFDAPAYHLTKLDRFLASRNATDLSAETLAAWSSTLSELSSSGRRQRMRIVYHFCLFRRRSEPGCFVPDPSQFPPPQPRSSLHIYTEDEITALLQAAEVLRPHAPSPLHRQVARLAVVLLYTTGLRRGELVRLTLGDYDATEQFLFIRETKFHKSRLVPLSSDAAHEMDVYLQDRRQPGFPCGADTPLLLNRHGGRLGYTGAGLGSLLRKLIREADIRTAKGRRPRVHDLRFTFAVNALLRWYRTGIDVQARLPALSIYMGHSSVVSTQYYLTFVDDLAHAACERFDQHCSRFLQPHSSSGEVR